MSFIPNSSAGGSNPLMLTGSASSVEEIKAKIQTMQTAIQHMSVFLKAIDEALYIEGWNGFTPVLPTPSDSTTPTQNNV